MTNVPTAGRGLGDNLTVRTTVNTPAGYLLAVVILVLNVCIGAVLLGAGLAQLTADVPLTPAEIVAKMLSFTVLTVVAGGLLATLYRSARTKKSHPPTQMTSPAER